MKMDTEFNSGIVGLKRQLWHGSSETCSVEKRRKGYTHRKVLECTVVEKIYRDRYCNLQWNI